MLPKILIIKTLKAKSTILSSLFLSILLFSCNKKTEDTFPFSTCKIIKYNGGLGKSGSFEYNSQNQVTVYKQGTRDRLSTLEYDLKGNMVKMTTYDGNIVDSKSINQTTICQYDEKNSLKLFVSTFIQQNKIDSVFVTINDKKQVIMLKNDVSISKFEYDLKGNLIRISGSLPLNEYLSYEYDSMKNPFQDFPWVFKYYNYSEKIFGENNMIGVNKNNSVNLIGDTKYKYEYNTVGYPTKMYFVDGMLQTEFEYKCD